MRYSILQKCSLFLKLYDAPPTIIKGAVVQLLMYNSVEGQLV